MPIVPSDSQNETPAAPVQPMTPVETSPTSGTGGLSASTVAAPTPTPPPSPVIPQQSSDPAPVSNLFPLQNYEDVKIRAARATQYGKTPEQAARIFSAEQKTGLPTTYIEENLDEVEKQADMQGFSAADFAKRSPKFASWIAQNPNNYALSKDDLDNGRGLESAVNDYSLMQSAHDSLYKGFADFNAGLAKLPAFAYDIAAVPQNLASKIPGLEGLETRAPSEWYNNSVTKYFEEKSKISLDNNPDLQADMLEMISKKQYERAGRAVFANVVTNAPNAIALMFGAGAGLAKQSLAFAGAQTGAQAAGSEESQKVDPLTGTIAAVTKGGFEAVFEEMGTLSVLEKWSKGLMNKVGRTSATEVIKNFSKMMVSSFLQEGSEEAVTSAAQDMTDYLTGVNPGAIDGMGKRMLEAGIIGGFSGTGMTAPAGFGMSVIHARANKQTELQKNFYKAIGESAEASKIRERLPEKYREMAEKVMKDGPVENIYIPVEKFTELFQSYENGGLTGAISDLEADKSFQDAKDSGGLVQIKTSIWAEKVAGTDHFNAARGNITFNPQEFTENESKEAAKALAEDPTSFDPSQFDGEKAVDGMTVQQQVQKMLEDTGMSPENARKNAVVYRFFDTLAKRSGKTAEQIFGEYNLNITRPVPNAQVNNFTPDQAMKPSDPIDFNSMIEEIRADKIPTDSKIYGKSLLQFIRSKGGIKNSPEVSDLEKGMKGKKLVNSTATLEVDKLAMDAVDAGYLKDADPNALIEAIGKEISGTPVYSTSTTNNALEEKKLLLSDFKKHLDRLGVDLQTMKNEEIIKKLEENNTPGFDPENFMLQMGGRGSKNAPVEKLSQAAQMHSSGKDMEEIRKSTGWFMGADGRWRYEISDEGAKLLPVKIGSGKVYKLDQVIEHKALFEAYPQLKDLNVRLGLSQGKKSGHFDRVKNEILVNVDKITPGFEKQTEELQKIRDSEEYAKLEEKYVAARTKAMKHVVWNQFKITETGQRYVSLTKEMEGARKVTPKNLSEVEKSTLLHEIQHAIQNIEGFTRGAKAGKSGFGMMKYFNSHGEVEARDTSDRRDFTDQQRKETAPATSTWNSPIVNWAQVTAELPIESIPPDTLEQIKFGEQLALFQSKNEVKRGRILFDSKGNFNIEFLKKADASTFLHETAHFFLEVMGDQASKDGASDGLKEDYSKILKHLGVESRDQIGVDQHEKFAESWEKYLMEGKAPSSELRDAFATFKAWFIGIYKSITNAYPGVNLNDDIRGVFDRMLATEEEITIAQYEIGATPLIPNTDGVLSKSDAEKYVKLIELERETAADQARAKAMKTLTREMVKIRKDREIEIREDVTREVENLPDQIILSIIRTGEAPGHPKMPPGSDNFRLDRRTVNKLYDEKLVSQLPRGIFGKDGQHPNIVAGLLMGSQSTGADLITMLANIPDKKKLIEQKVQEQMNQEFPDPILDGSIVQSAMEAVHNDLGSERRQFEIDVMMKNRPAAVKGMIKSITARKISIAQFRSRAEIIIGTTAVRDIRPIVYTRGEIKHAKEAVRLFLKGDFDGAIEAKQKEILNHELYRVAIKAQEEVQKAQDRFNKVFQKDEKLAKTRDMAYVNAARAVLADFGIGRSENDAEHYLSGIKSYNPDLYIQMKEMVDLATANSGDHRDVTFNVFSDMANSFDQLWNMSKFAHQITVDGKKLNRFTAQEEMITIIQEHSQNRGQGEEFSRAPNEKDERKMTYGSLKSALRRVEFWVDQMDNGRIGGAFRRYIWEPVSGGVIQYRLAKNEYMDQFLKLVQDHTKGFSEESIKAPELVGLPNDAGVPSAYLFQNKAELLGAMLHIGNESNLAKLIVGNKWGSIDENGNLDSSNWDSFISRMIKEGTITKSDYDFLQGCWDLMEKLKPNAQKAHYEVYGYHFSEITSQEFSTPFGTYKGGYAPAAIDRLRVKNDKAQLKALEEGTDANYFPAQINGFTKSRVQVYNPLSMNLNLLPMHVDQVLRFTHITPRIKDVTKMLFDKNFRAALEGFDPHVIDDFLVPWLDRTVKQSVVAPTKNKAADKFFRNLRSKTGMATMFLNVTNTLQQYTGILVASVKVAPKHLRNATWNFVKNNKEMADFAYETSDFMKTKINFQMSETKKEISKILQKPSANEKVSEWFEKNAYALQGIAQNQVDLIVWHAAYSQAQDEGHNQNICTQLADSALRTTQGTFAPEDVSRFETGSPMGRLFTMFSSYFNMLGNLLGSEFAKTIQQDLGIKKTALRGLYIYAVGFMIPAVMSEAIVRAMSGKGFDSDDDDDYLDDFMSLFFGSQLKTATALTPIVGQPVMAAINRFNSQQWDDRISVSPVMTMAEAVAGVPYDIYKTIETGEISKNAVRDSLTLISLMSGSFGIPKLPVLPFAKPVNYLQDVDSGRANPSGAMDVARGLITGKPGK